MDERRKRRVLFAVMMAVFLAAMESTVVALAMPTVVAQLGGLGHYSWVFSGYLLTQTVSMPLWGRFSDIYGRRAVYVVGLATFLVGSALSGMSQDMIQLIGFRMLQGFGAGSLMTLGYTIIGEIFGLERRAKMQGYISGVWGVASMVGPPVGGLLTDHASWRWVFFLNIPVGLIAMFLVATALSGEPRPARRPAIDWWGTAWFTAGVALVMLGLAEAGHEAAWSGWQVLAPLGVGLGALGVFLVVEARAPEPIVPLGLFASRIVVAAVITRGLAAMAMFGTLAFVPLFVQAVIGLSATRSGAILVPFVLGWVALSAISARLVLRVGYRGVVITGMVCLSAAFLLMTAWGVELSVVGAMRDVLLAGIGMGLVIVPMLIAVQSAVSRSDLGLVTSVTQFFMSIGGAVGVSVMGTVMAQRLAAGRPLVDALHGVFVTGLVVCAGALAAAFLVPSGRAQELARADMRSDPGRTGG